MFTQTRILVEGDRGSAELDRDYRIRVTTKSGTHSRRHAPVWKPWMNPQHLASHASIPACNADFLAAFRGEKEAETTGEDNLKTIRLTFAAYESARCGRVIHLTEGLRPEILYAGLCGQGESASHKSLKTHFRPTRIFSDGRIPFGTLGIIIVFIILN